MSDLSNLSFMAASQSTAIPKNAQQTKVEPKKQDTNKATENKQEGTKPKKEIVYVSKNPDAAVNAAGVVAGTSGMVGGAILGGVAGAVRIPRELGKIAFDSDYGKNLGDTFKNLKSGIVDSAEVKELVNAFKGVNAPVAGESVIAITGALRENLNVAFNNDKNAKAVIDKIFDPIIYSLTPRNNRKTGFVAGWMRILAKKGKVDPATVNKFEFWAQQPGVKGTVAKLLGFNKSTSRIIGDVVGNFGQGFSQAVLNIQNFTPEERAAWGRVSDRIAEEFEKNPSLKKFKNIAQAAKNMSQDSKWLSEPLKAFTDALHGNIEGIKNMIKTLDKNVIKAIALKTVLPGALIGATVCGTLSTLGWFGLKKGLMTKENEKAIKTGQV